MNTLITREAAANLSDEELSSVYGEWLAKKTAILNGATEVKAKKNKFVFEQFNELYEAKELKNKMKFEARFKEIGEAAYYE